MSEDMASERLVVLVVDDAPSSLALLCRMLEDAGYTVLVASDGEMALERLRLVVPDAILLDAMMPGMSGFDTCRLIKADPGLTHIPVIFMTGLSDTDSVLQGFDSGGVDYVVKPVRAPEVLARLHTHTRNARIARLARDAVDIATLGVVLVDTQGRIAWRSPKAIAWLQDLSPHGQIDRLPPSLTPVLTAQSSPDGYFLRGVGEQAYIVKNLGRTGVGETMLLVERQTAASGASSRLAHAALTPREAEVLSWLSKGKTNRDIGDILGLSHRTVNKHLEHIFRKLGVETRSAAAALASAGLDSGVKL
ncbi:MAG: response regulator transcription factor [Thiomonas sp.]|nr:response regulator transcription factor [Thiomonas sp.]